MTSTGLAYYLGQNHSVAAHRRLTALVELGYLAKRYDASYRLQNRPAEYYLSKKVIPVLRETLEDVSEREIKQFYARPTASRRFINRSIALFMAYFELRRLYGDRLLFATKPELMTEGFDYMPSPLPDGYMVLDKTTSRIRLFFVEYFDDAVSIGIHGRTITRYMNYKEEGYWDDTGYDFPTVMIICQSESLLMQAKKRIRYLERQEYSEIAFRLITTTTLKTIDSTKKRAWSDPIDRVKTTL